MEKKEKLGALWEGTTKNGQTYFTGSIGKQGEEQKVIVFANRKRPDKKDPDYVIYKSEPRGEGFERGPSLDDDSIPF